MEDEIETIKYRGCIIKIYRDDDYTQSPDEWGNEDVFLVHYHRDFTIERNDIITEDELTEWYNGEKIEKEKEYHIFLTKAYIHSGIVLALEKSGRIFPDERWDVSRCGCILVSKKETKSRKKAYELAGGLIKTWNDYLSGNVYGFTAEDEKNGVDIDSCWGFYGDFESSGIINEAKDSIDYYLKNERKKATKKKKDFSEMSLGELLSSDNNIIKRHSLGILKKLQSK